MIHYYVSFSGKKQGVSLYKNAESAVDILYNLHKSDTIQTIRPCWVSPRLLKCSVFAAFPKIQEIATPLQGSQ
jgi:hypothetical protein